MFSFLHHKYPYLSLLIPVISGILWTEHNLPSSSEWVVCGMLFFGIAVLAGIYFKSFGGLFITGVFGFLFFLAIHQSTHRIAHFQEGKEYLIEGECLGVLHSHSYIIRSAHSKLYLQLPDTISSLTIGDSFRFRAKLFSLKSSSNLYEFDFNGYLTSLGIQARAIPLSAPVRTGRSPSIYSRCQQIRDILLRKTERIVQDTTARSLIQSLCLGYRQEISPETKNLFQQTGTIHLLAISGLHVGAIYLLLSYILRLLRVKPKNHGWILIPFVWLFAGITGGSPSVCRTASILTFISVGHLLKRDHTSLNAIGVSAFFTLLLYPHLLFSVSFQMSYAAYSGIIIIYPLLHPKPLKKPKIFRWTYSLFCVSLAAQISTLPLTAYYFHDISLNSILINIIAVPLATILFYSGIILLLLPTLIGSYIVFLPIGLSHFLLEMLRLLHPISFLQKDIYPTTLHLVLLYSFILCSIIYLKTRKYTYLPLSCMILFALLIYSSIHVYHQQNQSEIIIYHRYKQTSILLNHKGYYTFLKNNRDYSTPLPYVIANRLTPLPDAPEFIHSELRFTGNRLVTAGKTIYIADRENRQPDTTDILIITENLLPHHLPIPESVLPAHIVLDASNSPRTIRTWEKWCNLRKVHLLKTNEAGSLVLSLKQNSPP